MTDNWARCILLAGFVILAPIGLYYRLQSYTGEQLDRRQEGWWILLTLRPLGIAFAVGVIAYLIEPQWMAWSSIQLPSGARWLGVSLVVANTLVADSWYLAVTGISSFAVMILRTSIEEHNLLERFGEDYAKYKQRTGRFLPKLGRTDLQNDSSD